MPTFNNWQIVTLPQTNISMVDFTSSDTVAVNTSPYTGQMQTYDWGQSIVSATVTLATLTPAQGQNWIAALQSCRGPLNVFQFGDPSQTAPLGVVNTNLIPDPYFTLPIGLAWQQPDANWFIAQGAGYSRSNALTIAGAESGGSKSSLSAAIPVVAGQHYTFSGFGDASAVTSGQIAIVVTNASISVNYATLIFTAGNSGYFTTTFTAPTGVTSVYIACEMSSPVYPVASNISFSAIRLTAGAPAVNGASQSGYTVVTDGWQPSTANILSPGDYLSIASAPVNSGDVSISRLFRATAPVSSDGAGNATINIYPPLRESPADNTAITLTNTQGLFRLMNTQQKWNVNHNQTTSLSFQIIEAI